MRAHAYMHGTGAKPVNAYAKALLRTSGQERVALGLNVLASLSDASHCHGVRAREHVAHNVPQHHVVL